MAPSLEEIKEAMNQSLEESTQKKLEEESDGEAAALPVDMDDETGLVADMSSFCLKK